MTQPDLFEGSPAIVLNGGGAGGGKRFLVTKMGLAQVLTARGSAYNQADLGAAASYLNSKRLAADYDRLEDYVKDIVDYYIRVEKAITTPPPREGKRVAATSRESFHQELSKIPVRQYRILERIANSYDCTGKTFTSSELIKNLGEKDVNNVRPELTRLRDKKYLQTGEKRVCTITKKRVYTWLITDAGREQLKIKPE